MNKINKAIKSIRSLECPTGELENRLAGILVEYGVAGRTQINIDREKILDTCEAQAYKVGIADKGQPLIVMAQSGYDDYVARVVDVYIGQYTL